MSGQQSKAELIEERKAALPLPEQPPVASDWNSADASTVNVGSGGVSDNDVAHGRGALRGPATGDSAVRTDGDANAVNTEGQRGAREGKDGLDGLPSDAVARSAKGKAGLSHTTNDDAKAQ